MPRRTVPRPQTVTVTSRPHSVKDSYSLIGAPDRTAAAPHKEAKMLFLVVVFVLLVVRILYLAEDFLEQDMEERG
jgi:hypothetical protein